MVHGRLEGRGADDGTGGGPSSAAPTGAHISGVPGRGSPFFVSMEMLP